MQRLIDADAYAAEMRKRQENCRAWKDGLVEGTELYARAEQSLMTFVEAALTLKSQPIIDAIPVEWLREFDLYFAGITGGSPYFRELLEAWQKEQEAIEENSNEGKTGTWKPLGHIIGYMNHPCSEYYKCSLCGHEQYTVFDLPPDTCPACCAHLTIEQEANHEHPNTPED